MKKEKIRRTNKSLIVLGSLLLLSGITLLGYKLYNTILEKEKIDSAIEEYYEEEIPEQNIEEVELSQKENTVAQKEIEYNYIAILRITKINLKGGLVNKDSKYNDIKYNIMIHKESDNPDKEGGNVILLAHSGTSKISYFRNLYKLKLNDKIYLDYNNKTYTYKIINIYDIKKNGKASIRKNTKESSITLITCRTGTNNQIVIIGEKVK